MASKFPVKSQNLSLAAAYIKMNEEGRRVLDTAIQKLAEIRQIPTKTASNTPPAIEESSEFVYYLKETWY